MLEGRSHVEKFVCREGHFNGRICGGHIIYSANVTEMEGQIEGKSSVFKGTVSREFCFI